MKKQINAKVSLLLFIVGLAVFTGGIFISWLPTYTIYLGYAVLAVGLFGVLCPDGCWRLRTFHIFLICWASGAVLTTMLFIPMSMIAMFSTLPIHLPLLALACHIARREDHLRHLAKLFPPAAFLLAVILPHFMVVTFRKPYPLHPEQIIVSADSIEDKRPPFIDDSSMWHQNTVQNPFYRQPIKYRINKSAAVVGLDFGKLKDEENVGSEQLFTTYRQALLYAKQNKLPVIPSVQMIDHKAKVFSDLLYAAIEKHMQFEAKILGGGKQSFIKEVLTELLKTYDNAEGQMEAIAYIAAGLHIGGDELPELPQAADKLRKKLESNFLSEPVKCKPIGFYAESEELKRIFRQDRFYQTRLTHAAAIELARIMVKHPDLRKKYQSILALTSRMTNPLSRFSVDDIAEYKDYFDDPSTLISQMLKSEKWRVLKERGAGRNPREKPFPCIQFMPHSTSKENQLFAKIYNYSPELPRHNIMNMLIRAIRSGEIDLIPKTDSGWYDYQIHALETLLVTEKGQESDKLLLTEDYKRRLIEAFKTILTKKRELHVKQVELLPTAGISLGSQYFTISPDLHVEPMATYYLRTARGCRFLLNCLELILGKSALEDVDIENGECLLFALKNMATLYYGLYLQVCDDIGMNPEFLPDEISNTQILQAKQQTGQWLDDYEKESFCEKDVRYIVPALTNLNRTQVRYWMVIGVKLLKIKADYIRRPLVQILDTETEKVIQEIPTGTESGDITDSRLQYKFAPEEYYLPIEIFAEATGSAEPPTREEFHKLCDRCKNKKEIISAIESRAIFTVSKPLIFFVIASALIVVSIALFRLVKKNRNVGE
ncbi:MAG: hypothetical protein ACYS32_04740 [Planctomycetota bacterium]